MPLRSDWSGDHCPISRSLDVLGDPWVLVVLRETLLGSRRYDQLRDRLAVADNVLSRRLREMVEAGLLERRPYRDGGRTRHEYVPTAAAEDALPVLHALVLWGERHTSPPADGGHLALVCEACDAESETSDSCSECGALLRPDTVSWQRPWLTPVRTLVVGAGTAAG